MHRFHFVHTAGLCLNAPFRGVGRVPSRIRDVLAGAAAGAWDDLVDGAISRRVEFVIIAGGIEAGDEFGLAGRLRLSAGLKRLAEHGIRSFLAVEEGQRDVTEFLSDANSELVTVFPSDQPTAVAVQRGERLLATVCGQSGGGEIRYRDFFKDGPEDAPRIGVVPGTVDELEAGLAGGGPRASYWALGDALHASRRGFSPWIVESGSLQGRSFADDEAGAHGAMIVEVEGGRVLAVDQLAVDRVRYAAVSVNPRFATDDALLCHEVMDELNRLRATHSGRALLVDVAIAAAEHQPAPTISPERIDSILERLRNDTAGWDPFVWCANLSVAGEQPRESNGDAIAQAIVQESRALLGNSLQRSYYFARRFEPLMRRWTSELDTGDAERLIADATRLALHTAGDTASGD